MSGYEYKAISFETESHQTMFKQVKTYQQSEEKCWGQSICFVYPEAAYLPKTQWPISKNLFFHVYAEPKHIDKPFFRVYA